MVVGIDSADREPGDLARPPSPRRARSAPAPPRGRPAFVGVSQTGPALIWSGPRRAGRRERGVELLCRVGREADQRARAGGRSRRRDRVVVLADVDAVRAAGLDQLRRVVEEEQSPVVARRAGERLGEARPPPRRSAAPSRAAGSRRRRRAARRRAAAPDRGRSAAPRRRNRGAHRRAAGAAPRAAPPHRSGGARPRRSGRPRSATSQPPSGHGVDAGSTGPRPRPRSRPRRGRGPTARGSARLPGHAPESGRGTPRWPRETACVPAAPPPAQGALELRRGRGRRPRWSSPVRPRGRRDRAPRRSPGRARVWSRPRGGVS